MFRRFALTAAALITSASMSLAGPVQQPAAQAPTLKAGAPAPALTVEKWVKGTPVANFEKGKIYVIEFWATWCGPCIASMPHVSALQRKYKDKGLTIIGLTSVDKNNSLAAVEKMVADKGDGMDYTVAWDVERTTNSAYMKAAGRGGIPCSFLIDGQGRIAYIGHPQFLDEPLAGVLAGTWDSVKQAEPYEALQTAYWAARGKAKRDPKGTLAYILEFEKQHPALEHLVTQVKFDAGLAAGDFDAAYAAAGTLVDQALAAKDVSALNQLAWTIVDPEVKLERRDLELALRAAQKGAEFSEEKDAAVLDTLARVWAWKGDYKKALEIETKAAALNDARFKDDIEKALAEYKAKQT